MPRLSVTIAAASLIASLAIGTPPAIGRDRGVPPEAIPVGTAKSCIPIRSIRETKVYGDNVIDFRMSGKRVYRNTLPHSCPRLGFEESFSYATSLSQLCSTDIITVLHTNPPMRGASCGLGEFQPVELAPKGKAAAKAAKRR